MQILLKVALPGLAIAAGQPPQTPPRWSVSEEIRIGSADDPKQALTRIGSVVIGPDGHLYVSQPAEMTIRVFDRDGRGIRSIGRSGKGPGEFQDVTSIGFAQDTFYAADQALRRVSLYLADGTLVRDFRFTSPLLGEAMPRVFLPTVPALLLEDGSGLVSPGPTAAWVETGEARIPFLRIWRDSPAVDTIAWFDIPFRNFNIHWRGRRLGMGLPFPDFPIRQFLADGTGIVVVDRRTPVDRDRGTYEVSKIGLAGDTTFRRSFSYDPAPVQGAMVTDKVEEIRLRLAQVMQPPTAQAVRDALRDARGIPPSLPPVTQVTSGVDGSIWLRREETLAPHARWDVLSASGQLIGLVDLPARQSVAAIHGDVLVTTEEDSLGLPYVTRYRIHRE